MGKRGQNSCIWFNSIESNVRMNNLHKIAQDGIPLWVKKLSIAYYSKNPHVIHTQLKYYPKENLLNNMEQKAYAWTEKKWMGAGWDIFLKDVDISKFDPSRIEIRYE